MIFTMMKRIFNSFIPTSHPRLRQALILLDRKFLPSSLIKSFELLTWELMKTQTKLSKMEKFMDKKMHQITKRMQTASKDLKKGKTKQAEKTLKKAEKKNEKLVKQDREVRDPLIKKCKKEMHIKLPQNFGKLK